MSNPPPPPPPLLDETLVPLSAIVKVHHPLLNVVMPQHHKKRFGEKFVKANQNCVVLCYQISDSMELHNFDLITYSFASAHTALFPILKFVIRHTTAENLFFQASSSCLCMHSTIMHYWCVSLTIGCLLLKQIVTTCYQVLLIVSYLSIEGGWGRV